MFRGEAQAEFEVGELLLWPEFADSVVDQVVYKSIFCAAHNAREWILGTEVR